MHLFIFLFFGKWVMIGDHSQSQMAELFMLMLKWNVYALKQLSFTF